MGIKIVFKQTDAGVWASDNVDFNIVDVKGRAVGTYAVITYAYSWVRDQEGPGSHKVEDTTRFFVITYALRAGKQFGAAFPRPTVIPNTGLDVAKAFATKKIEQAQKRAVKNHTVQQ